MSTGADNVSGFDVLDRDFECRRLKYHFDGRFSDSAIAKMKGLPVHHDAVKMQGNGAPGEVDEDEGCNPGD